MYVNGAFIKKFLENARKTIFASPNSLFYRK